MTTTSGHRHAPPGCEYIPSHGWACHHVLPGPPDEGAGADLRAALALVAAQPQPVSLLREWLAAESECGHESESGDEGPVAKLPGGLHTVVRWRCDGCGRVRYDDASLDRLRALLAAVTERLADVVTIPASSPAQSALPGQDGAVAGVRERVATICEDADQHAGAWASYLDMADALIAAGLIYDGQCSRRCSEMHRYDDGCALAVAALPGRSPDA